ncbi:MAG: SDR family oxidoreductase [Sphingobium sp.]
MTAQEQRVALVVGGSGGIGRAVSQRLAQEGCTVIVASRSPPASSDHEAMVLDITDHGSCRTVANAIAARFGRLDYLLNCASIAAGTGLSGPFAQTDPAQFAAASDGSITATFNIVHAMTPLLAQKGGAILLFASDAALYPSRNQAIVGPTRAAIVNFTRNYALEAAASGIRVNCISLSYVRDTPIFDQLVQAQSSRVSTATARAGLGLPAACDVAPLAAFLCSDDARHITGQVVSINGGLSA